MAMLSRRDATGILEEPAGDPLWIFGYGSLMWRPAFPHIERRPGFVEGWARRFWQGSTDHRGVPGAPGRVVTLVPTPGAVCWGVAFRFDTGGHDQVLAKLDHRERGGFERREVDVHFHAARRTPEVRSTRALVYVATERNPNFLGPASLDVVAQQVRGSHGPSGSNLEYVRELARCLRDLDARDPHVFALEALLEGEVG